MRQVPLRLTLITGILVLALGETVLLFVSANTYRDLAYDNQRQALSELIGATVANQLRLLDDQSRDIATALQARQVLRSALAARDVETLTNVLNSQFHQYFVTAGVGRLNKLYILDVDLNIVAVSSEGVELDPPNSHVCPHLIARAVTREGPDKIKPLSELCVYRGKAQNSMLVPIGSFRAKGYVLIVTNPAFSLRTIDAALRIPIRATHYDGTEEFRSEKWPSEKDLHGYLSAEYTTRDAQGRAAVHVVGARDVQAFRERLENTTWVVVSVAVMLSAPLFLLALFIFDRMAARTTNLIDDLEGEIGERKIAQEAMLLAKHEAERANRAKSLFLANMSHEIRTPMNAILGYAQILDHDPDLNEKHKRTVSIITRSGNHLLDLINEILDISKIEAGRMEINESDFDLPAMIGDLANMFALRCSEKNIEWRVFCLNGMTRWQVRGDQGKLRQILINLLGNAVKFTDRGRVSLRVDVTGENRIRFAVDDTGPGISDSQKQLVFESFYQAEEGHKKGGTGLGLAIARRQVELMGGELLIESRLGGGCKFYFTLPLTQVSKPAYESNTSQELATGDAQNALESVSMLPSAAPTEPSESPDWSQFPPALLVRIREQAELGVVAELQTALDELEALNDDGRRLAEQLREMSGRYDFDGVARLLSDAIEAPQ